MRARGRLFVLAAAAAFGLAGAPAQAWTIVVVTAAGDPRVAVSADELARIYRRRQRIDDWGRRVEPVNLPAHDPVRRAFSLLVYGRLPEELADFWNAQYFHGIQPPHVVQSTEAMRRFLRATPGAIGYVPACRLDARLQVLATLEAPAGSDPPGECAPRPTP